ncbi:MAG: serine protein kinase PrkA [bacterium]|nr:serine protein kinase PrkA [bacterium]
MPDEAVKKAVSDLNRSMDAHERSRPIPFNKFLKFLAQDPRITIRSIFQVFHDMIKSYVGDGVDEYPNDPESIGFISYDCTSLLAEGTDRPFFADRLFANRLVALVEALRRGAQQNKIYIFQGPPGCGKSTFLNTLLMKFEAYANTDQGVRYEAVWRLDRKTLGGLKESNIAELEPYFNTGESDRKNGNMKHIIHETDEYVEIPCPSHDSPLLVIPKALRRAFFDNLFKNDKFKWQLFTAKEYEWVFRDNACTICSSIYKALMEKLDHPSNVFDMLYAEPYQFNRRLGNGISVYNPGDKPLRKAVMSNEMLQHRLDGLLKDSNRVRYLYSHYARTNNGIYALMDIKSHNKERLIDLHNIISEGLHKVEYMEENVHSLFLALMNPEDKKNVDGIQSFQDRIQYIKVPYVLDLRTEVEIYRNIFGKHIHANFLPKVLHNFARVIISSRLKKRSDALLEWIKKADKYKHYCDKDLLLLKMEIYTGHIPTWLDEADLKLFTSKVRKKIIAESEVEGDRGFSGRESIKIFNRFYSAYACEEKLITMSMLKAFFQKVQKERPGYIPVGFLEALCNMYNYNVLQEVKEALYYYNEERISEDIKDYLFAVNFDPGTTVKSVYTGKQLRISEDFFKTIEARLLGQKTEAKIHTIFRKDIQRIYASQTLTGEMMVEGKDITETELYETLKEKYIYNLKEKVLEPFLENENFRRAIKDYDTEDFKTYDNKIREDVSYLITNLTERNNYTKKGAKEVCIYVVDNDIAKKFEK